MTEENPDPNARACEVQPVDKQGVHGFLHMPSQPTGDGLILTHGAGANCHSPLLVTLARAFCQGGMTVLRYDLPFRQARPHGPPMRGSDLHDRKGIKAALEYLKSRVKGQLFAAGHSYGGRQTTILLTEQPGLADGLLLLSYPLHPPKKPDQLRTAHFPDLNAPSLFVHGTRDGFGSIAEMTEALKLIPARTQLLAIEGAGHELISKRNASDLPTKVVAVFAGFTA